MQPKPQIVFVHGGNSFASGEEFHAALLACTFDPYSTERKRWREQIETETAHTHEYLFIDMPNKQNADYQAWAIWFDKVVPYLREGAILIGNSLGGGFYLRYLTENTLPVSIKQLHLVAPCVHMPDSRGVGGFQIDLPQWTTFKTSISAVHLWHSVDDKIVPVEQSEQFKIKYPTALLHTFTDRGHFLTETFPELLTEIQK